MTSAPGSESSGRSPTVIDPAIASEVASRRICAHELVASPRCYHELRNESPAERRPGLDPWFDERLGG